MGKKRKASIAEEEADIDSELKVKKKKKKGKHKYEAEELASSLCVSDAEKTGERTLNGHQPNECSHHQRKKAKKKKKKQDNEMKEFCSSIGDAAEACEDHLNGDVNDKKSKKKKKKKQGSEIKELSNVSIVGEATEACENQLDGDVTDKKSKKEKKKMQKNNEMKEFGSNIGDVAEACYNELNGGANDKKSKKKKKRREGILSECSESRCNSSMTETSAVEELAVCVASGNTAETEESESRKVKHKKRKSKSKIGAANLVETEVSVQSKVKKNKKQKYDMEKKKDVKHLGQINTDEKDEQSVENFELLFPRELSAGEKSNSQDSVTARLANKEEPAGQWKTAAFEDEKRQEKFLRLLGGFKKDCDTTKLKNKFQLGNKGGNFKGGNTKSSQGTLPWQNCQGRLPREEFCGNLAMNKAQEEKYKKDMENQFDKALAFQMNRGKTALGLGFQKPPEEGKKFYIDIDKSKSIKFDD